MNYELVSMYKCSNCGHVWYTQPEDDNTVVTIGGDRYYKYEKST